MAFYVEAKIFVAAVVLFFNSIRNNYIPGIIKCAKNEGKRSLFSKDLNNTLKSINM